MKSLSTLIISFLCKKVHGYVTMVTIKSNLSYITIFFKQDKYNKLDHKSRVCSINTLSTKVVGQIEG